MSDTAEATVPPGSPAPTPADPARRGVSVVAAVIVLTLLWYLLADRYTPYTQQARVQALIVPVAAEVSGQVTQVHAQNNQTVEAGQDLFEIDPEPFQIAVERARADLEATRRQVGASTAAIDSAVASLRAAQANELQSRQDRDRLERLYHDDPGTISLRRLEISRATFEQAVAKVAASEADVQRAREQEGGSSEDNAQLRSATTTLTKAELDLAKTRIRASSAGLVTDLRTEVGQFAAAGKPVLTLITVDDVWISAEFTENNLGHVRPGTPVRIVLDALPGRVFKGKVRSIGYGVSVGSETPPGSLPTAQNNRDWLRAAQRFPVIIEFERGQLDEPRALRIGGQAEVMAFPSDGNPLNLLGRMFLRVMSWLSFAY
jgi:multidrug resistance efflux pump